MTPGQFNYESRFKYPHLIGEDSLVWQRFIDKYPDKFNTVDYDLKVGEGVKTDLIPDEHSKLYWAMLTKKRIDVIGYKNNFITLIEVKKRVGLCTLGQILGYKFLYLREHPEEKNVSTLVICSAIDPDDQDILNHYGIHFIIV